MTPDIANPLIENTNPGTCPLGEFCNSWQLVDLPDTTVSGNHHIAVSWETGDTTLWLCADSDSTPTGCSKGSSDDYATPAFPFTSGGVEIGDFMLRKQLKQAPGTLFVNQSLGPVTVGQNSTLGMMFFGSDTGQLSALFITVVVPPIPGNIFTGLILPTGFNHNCDCAWELIAGVPCSAPAGIGLGFKIFWLDSTMLKPNGNPTLKISNLVQVNFAADNQACNPAFCWGRRDDGQAERFWKVQGGSGSQDYFSTKHDTINNLGTPIDMVTGMEIALLQTGCGPRIPPTALRNIGVYPDDGSGTAPDLGNPLVELTNAVTPVNVTQWGYPGTFYDVPDVSPDPDTVYHLAHNWQTGDTCVWTGGDTDFFDNGVGANPHICSNTDPANNPSSYFTLDGFQTGGIGFAGNWVMQIKWSEL
jgi:hypothetical protein